MQTVTIEASKAKPKEIKRLFEKKKIGKGDKIVVLKEKEHETTVLALLMLLIIVGVALAYVQAKKKNLNGAHVSDQATMPGFSVEFDTPEEVEAAIQEKFGVEIEVREKEEEFDPISALFGIWKDTDITIEKIRKQAWERTS